MDTAKENTFCKLVDIDWQLGVIAASSEDSLVGETFVHLKLTLDTEVKREKLHIELSVPQFYNLLHELEKARIAIES